MARQSELLPATPILLTRPQADSEHFTAALVAHFGPRVQPVISPLLAPQYLAADLPGSDYAAVVFTSAQAVEGARRLGAPLPNQAWCVGRKTAAVAAKAGFQARSADGDAEALAKAILSDPPNGRILYLRGVDTRGNLLEKLQSSGVDTDVAIVYTQDAQPLTQEAIALLCKLGPVIVPLFSPRTAALFRAALPADTKASLHIAAMSNAVSEALDGLPIAALAIANQPDASGMLAAVESLLAALPAP